MSHDLIAQNFQFAFGRDIKPEELETLSASLTPDASPSSLRTTLAVFDHQFVPTPVSVRLEAADLMMIEIEGVTLWLDQKDF